MLQFTSRASRFDQELPRLHRTGRRSRHSRRLLRCRSRFGGRGRRCVSSRRIAAVGIAAAFRCRCRCDVWFVVVVRRTLLLRTVPAVPIVRLLIRSRAARRRLTSVRRFRWWRRWYEWRRRRCRFDQGHPDAVRPTRTLARDRIDGRPFGPAAFPTRPVTTHVMHNSQARTFDGSSPLGGTSDSLLPAATKCDVSFARCIAVLCRQSVSGPSPPGDC